MLNSDKLSATNSKDQHTYILIASSAHVELDGIQFDYINWAEFKGTTEWIQTLSPRCYKGFCQCSNHYTRLDIHENKN